MSPLTMAVSTCFEECEVVASDAHGAMPGGMTCVRSLLQCGARPHWRVIEATRMKCANNPEGRVGGGGGAASKF